MIELIDITGKPFFLNCNLIETMESIPETKVSLTSGKYFLVSNSCEEIVEKVIRYNRRVFGLTKQISCKTDGRDENS
jgi:flagellar protein FlbD